MKLKRITDRTRMVWLSDCTKGEGDDVFYRAFLEIQENGTPKVRALRQVIDAAIRGAKEEGK